MSKRIPSVKHHMTPSPHSIGPDQPLSLAHKIMREHNIRHLPVLAAGKLVGVVTNRDLHLIETLRDVDPDKVTAEEAMSQTVYAVPIDTPLDEVADEMAEHKYGSAVIVDERGKVVGVFTTVDACRALGSLLRGERPREIDARGLGARATSPR